jgi:hypothetical protein
MNRQFRLIVVIASTWLAVACSECSEGTNEQVEVANNIEKTKGEALDWEAIPLGASRKEFLDSVWKINGMAAGRQPASKLCHEQFRLSVPDVGHRLMIERPAGDHRLSNCTVRPTPNNEQQTIIEIRASFIDGHSARLTYRFSPGEFASLSGRMKQRFGPGGIVNMTDDILSMEKPEEYQYWKSDDEIWLLGRTTGETALLIHQDLKASFSLPKPTPPSERGKPISLEDIGIGKLDLDATQPNIELPDAGHFEDAGPTNSSKK